MSDNKLKNIRQSMVLVCVAMLGLVFTAYNAHAACSTPAGSEGQLRYDSTTKKVYVCDGTDWDIIGSPAWTAMSLADTTTKFKTDCEYRWAATSWGANNGYFYVSLVYNPAPTTSALYVTHGTNYYVIGYANKAIYSPYNFVAGSSGANAAVASLQERCP